MLVVVLSLFTMWLVRAPYLMSKTMRRKLPMVATCCASEQGVSRVSLSCRSPASETVDVTW